jgi:hypothetical protein
MPHTDTDTDAAPDLISVRLVAALGYRYAQLYLEDRDAHAKLPLTEFVHPHHPIAWDGSKVVLTELDLDADGKEIGRHTVSHDLPAGWLVRASSEPGNINGWQFIDATPHLDDQLPQ